MDRYKDAKKVSIIGLVGNIFLFTIKIIVGIFTMSQSMLSDALNSFGDIITSCMTFFGNKISSKSADDEHNFGHGKVEYIYSLIISMMMIIFSLSVLFTSIRSIFIPVNYYFSNFLLLVCGITIIIKFLLYLVTHKVATRYNNLLVEANAKDHRNDCVLTALNLIATIFAFYNIYYIDGVIGGIISLWIMFVAIKLFKEAYDVLIDKGISNELKIKIINNVKKIPEIKKINHLIAAPVGYQYQISLTIFVDGNMSTYESHNIADKLEKDLCKLDEIYLAIIHVNPL